MARAGSVIGWKLDRGEREALLVQFPPTYDQPIADHVTLDAKVNGKPLPPAVDAAIVGRADDGQGVEAMVVAMDGSTDRPDGSTLHITWSLGHGRRAVESNAVIATRGWQKFDQPLPVTVTPARF